MSYPHLGIDLGTTFSCVAYFNDRLKRPEVIENDLGYRTTPSIVAFTDEGRLIGQAAKNEEVLNPTNAVFDAKRMIGKKYADPQLQADMEHWPFKVVQDSKGLPKIEVQFLGETKQFAPEEISSMVLQYLKQIAEKKLGVECKDVVITIPAYFNDAQREGTLQAGLIAGFNVLQVFNEPTAAAVAFGFEKPLDEKHTAFIFDFGGGTFDVSILEIANGNFTARGAEGDPHLGGQDFDNNLVKHFQNRFETKEKVKLSENTKECQRALKLLKIECEKLKITLSQVNKASIQIDNLYKDLSLEDTMARTMFEFINEDLFSKCLEPIETVLQVAGLETDDITDLILVGGSSRIPRVREMLSEQFCGLEPVAGVDPDEAVAVGAAIKCRTLHRSGVGGAPAVGGAVPAVGGDAAPPKPKPKPKPKPEPVPKPESEVLEIDASDSKPPTIVHPVVDDDSDDDENEIQVIDSTTLTLGIRVKNGKMQPLIPARTQIPCSVKKTFGTTEDNQPKANIIIYEGERPLVQDNRKLGKFTLNDLPPGPAGTVHFTVSLNIDLNGILTVTSVVEANGKSEVFHVDKEKGNLSDEEVERMIKEAEAYREQDAKRVEYITFANTYQDELNKLKTLARKARDTEAVKAIVNETYWLNDHSKPTGANIDEQLNELKAREQKTKDTYNYLLK